MQHVAALRMASVYSLVIPVYRNEDSIPELLRSVGGLAAELEQKLEVVFVVDGSPDRSMELRELQLPMCAFP